MHGIMIYSLQPRLRTRSIGQKTPPAPRAHQWGQDRVKYLAADCPTSRCRVDGVMLNVYMQSPTLLCIAFLHITQKVDRIATQLEYNI
jgi:hypothetical protein